MYSSRKRLIMVALLSMCEPNCCHMVVVILLYVFLFLYVLCPYLYDLLSLLLVDEAQGHFIEKCLSG